MIRITLISPQIRMLGEMHVELQTTCSALGYQEGNVYHKEPDCLETVKDLIRFLKREDESCDIRRQLGAAQILQNDLLPIIKQYSDDRVLWETVIRLMVNLTQPAVLCFQNHVPSDKTQRNYYLEIVGFLQLYKEAFVDEQLIAVITKKLGDLLQLDWENRQEEDRLLIERILILLRNILHVVPNLAKEQRTDDDASVHDQILWALHVSGMEDLLLYLASSEAEHQFAFHVLEIIALIFREQSPEQLASAGASRSVSERQKDERELEIIREQERAKKKAKVMQYSSRHSRFGGAFVVSNMKSISEREVITHRPVKDLKEISFDKNKVPKKKPKNRKPLTETEYTRRSTLSIRLFLKDFCIQFIEHCYNPLMSAVKDILVRAGAQENDETYYLWTMRFFMEFQRRHNFKVDFISETMSVPTFHYVQTNLMNYSEMMQTEKKEALVWSRRMHLALRAYYELLQSLFRMDQMKEPHIRESAKVIKSNVFYMMEYRDIFLTLLKKYDETRQSRGLLKDLVEATHLFLKNLEYHCKHSGHMVVQKKKRKKGGKKKQKSAKAPAETTITQQELEDLWDEISSDLSALFQGRGELPSDVLPFDAASEVDVEQQRAEAMIRIQEAMRGHKAGEAVALFRAAREVWPENGQFGHADISAEDEFMALREVFFANLPRSIASQENAEMNEENEWDDEVENEELEAHYDTVDENFNFKDYVARFANANVVRAYTLLLGNFQHNSAETNHALAKMLHRIGFDMGLIGMLFQARLFRVFQKIVNDPAAKTSHFKEIVSLAHHVVRKFVEVAQTNDKVFVELFFLKNVKEAFEIVEGYGATRDSVKGKVAWSEELEEELRYLFERFHDKEEDGKDTVDLIMEQITDESKTRRQIILALVHLGLLGSAKDLKRKHGPTKPRGWQEQEEVELRTLFEEHKESPDPVANIMDTMTSKKSKPAIKKKLLELGLVSDMKELRKKRSGKSGGKKTSKNPWGSEDVVDDGLPSFSSDSESDDNRPRNEGRSSDGESEAPVASDSEEENNDDPMYVREIKKAAKKVLAKGKQEAIKWIRSAIISVAEDREEEDDDEAIPIVPLTETQEDAMEDKDFKQLLKRIGAKQPANEQEKFWRVPGYLTGPELRSRAAALDISEADNNEGTNKKTDGGRLAALKALAKQKKDEKKSKERGSAGGKRRSKFRADVVSEASTPEPSGSTQSSVPDDGTSQASSSQSTPVRNSASKKRARVSLVSDSDDSGDEKLVIADESSRDSVHVSKRPRVVDDSDSEDNEPLSGLTSSTSQSARQINTSDEDEPESKINRTEDSSASGDEQSTKKTESFPATAFSMEPGSDSDSDLDDHMPLKRGLKKTAIIESDED